MDYNAYTCTYMYFMYDGVQEISTCHEIGVLFLPENTRKCEFENILIYE